MSHFKATVYHFQFPDPAGGAYSAPPDPLAALRGPTSKGREGTRPHHFTPLSHISGYAPGDVRCTTETQTFKTLLKSNLFRSLELFNFALLGACVLSFTSNRRHINAQ